MDNKYYIVYHRTNDNELFFVDFCREEDILSIPMTELYEKYDIIKRQYGCNITYDNQGLTKEIARSIQQELAYNLYLENPEFCCNDFKYQKKINDAIKLIDLYNVYLSFREVGKQLGLHESNVARRLDRVYRMRFYNGKINRKGINTRVFVDKINVEKWL